MSVRPIVFLDVDGVLNRHSTKPNAGVRECVLQREYSLTRHQGVVEEAVVAAFARMLAATNAQIVVSSSWREGVASAVAFADAIGLPPLASSPDIIHRDWRTGWKPSSYRFHEIGWWLDDHKRCTNYVVIDDHDFIPPDWKRPSPARFVKTNPERGLTNADLNRVCEILGRSDLAFVCETTPTDWFAAGDANRKPASKSSATKMEKCAPALPQTREDAA